MGTKDNIDPSMFINGGVKFSEPDEGSSQLFSESADTESGQTDPYLTGMKSRKRKHTVKDDRMGLMELMKEKFEDDKEERMKRMKLMEDNGEDRAKALKLMEDDREDRVLRVEKQDRREEEFLSLFKVVTEAFVRIAEKNHD